MTTWICRMMINSEFVSGTSFRELHNHNICFFLKIQDQGKWRHTSKLLTVLWSPSRNTLPYIAFYLTYNIYPDILAGILSDIFWHFKSCYLACCLTLVLTFYVPFCMTYILTYYLTYMLAFYLAFFLACGLALTFYLHLFAIFFAIPSSILLYTLWHSNWHILCHFIWHPSCHSIWHRRFIVYPRILTFLVKSDMFSGIYNTVRVSPWGSCPTCQTSWQRRDGKEGVCVCARALGFAGVQLSGGCFVKV